MRTRREGEPPHVPDSSVMLLPRIAIYETIGALAPPAPQRGREFQVACQRIWAMFGYDPGDRLLCQAMEFQDHRLGRLLAIRGTNSHD